MNRRRAIRSLGCASLAAAAAISLVVGCDHGYPNVTDGGVAIDPLPECPTYLERPGLGACVLADDGRGEDCMGADEKPATFELVGAVTEVGAGVTGCAPATYCSLGSATELFPRHPWCFRMADTDGMGWAVCVLGAGHPALVAPGDTVSVSYRYRWAGGRNGGFSLRDAAGRTLVWILQDSSWQHMPAGDWFGTGAPFAVRTAAPSCKESQTGCGVRLGYDVEMQTAAGWAAVPFAGETSADGMQLVNAYLSWYVGYPACTDVTLGDLLVGAGTTP